MPQGHGWSVLGPQVGGGGSTGIVNECEIEPNVAVTSRFEDTAGHCLYLIDITAVDNSLPDFSFIPPDLNLPQISSSSAAASDRG
jgi:hypothetical protein